MYIISSSSISLARKTVYITKFFWQTYSSGGGDVVCKRGSDVTLVWMQLC